MRHITLLLCTVVLIFASQPAIADDRSLALSNDFLFFCTLKIPDFDQIDQTAKSLNLAVKKDIHPTLPQGQSARSKGWFVGDKTGTYELTAAEAVNGERVVSSCGIGAPDALGTEMLNDITTKMHLNNPDRETIAPTGKLKTLEWKVSMGEEQMRITLIHAYPKGPGVYLFITREVDSGSKSVQ